MLTGIAHRLHLTVCNSLGLWLRKPKQVPSSSLTTTSISESESDSSDEDDLDDDSHQVSSLEEDNMSVDYFDEDQGTTSDNTTDDAIEDSSIDAIDNWSHDVLVDFDQSSCAPEQAAIGELMKKSRAFVKLVNKSSILKSYVNSVRGEFNITRTLQLDCKSRWNSSHRLLQTMLTYRKLINKLHSEKHEIKLNNKQTKKLASIELEKADWLLIESIERVLQPFVEATKLLSGRNYCTIGISFFSICQLREFLEDEKSSGSNESRILYRLKHLLLFNMEQYFEKDKHQWHLIKVRRSFASLGPCIFVPLVETCLFRSSGLRHPEST